MIKVLSEARGVHSIMKSAGNYQLTLRVFLLALSLCSFSSCYVYSMTSGYDTLQLAEKVYLHIDRTAYTSGDDIWFRAYVIDPATNNLSLNTNNLHVELIAPDSIILQTRILRISRGLGNGDFKLSDSIPSGTYRIRAYTNHMRNYSDDHFFIKEITVLNPYDDGSALIRPVREIENKLSIGFYPEGGSLIDNVTSTVAFKAVDGLGRGCDVTVELYTADDKLIMEFKSKHLGMGFFNVKPFPGYAYYAIARATDGTQVKAPLPASFPSGLAISTLVTPDNNLILTVSTNEVTLSSLKSHFFTVNLSSRNLVNKRMGIKVDALTNNYLIPLNGLPDGIIKVTLSEFEGLPLAERLFFIQRNDDVRLKVTTDRKEYKPREKVKTELTLSGNSSFSGTGEISLSAAQSRYTDNSSPYPRSISSWFLLESDVIGIIEEPSYYFDPANKDRLNALDLLLMTQGWRDFTWKYDSLSLFSHEIGFDITGKVRRIINKKPIEGIRINLGLFFGGNSVFLDTVTDMAGSFRFDKLDIYGVTEAFISSTGKFEQIQGKIYIDSAGYVPPGTEAFGEDSVKITIAEKDIPEFRQEAIYKIDEKKKYRLSDTISVGEVTITAIKAETPQETRVREVRRIYGTPDKEHIIPEAVENYAGDVFSYMSGRIPNVRILRGVDTNSIYYPQDVKIIVREQFSAHPTGALILLDGYEIDQGALGFVLSMPMFAIDRIDVLDASPLYGMRGAGGVVNIITKLQTRRDPAELTPNTAYKLIKGFDIFRVFYAPAYDKQQNEADAPDFRSTVFWKPDIRIENRSPANLSYFNADETCKIRIIVEGITSEGIPLTAKTEYVVK